MLLFYTILNRGRAFLLIKLILQIMPTISCWRRVGFHLLYVFTNIYRYSGTGMLYRSQVLAVLLSKFFYSVTDLCNLQSLFMIDT